MENTRTKNAMHPQNTTNQNKPVRWSIIVAIFVFLLAFGIVVDSANDPRGWVIGTAMMIGLPTLIGFAVHNVEVM